MRHLHASLMAGGVGEAALEPCTQNDGRLNLSCMHDRANSLDTAFLPVADEVDLRGDR